MRTACSFSLPNTISGVAIAVVLNAGNARLGMRVFLNRGEANWSVGSPQSTVSSQQPTAGKPLRSEDGGLRTVD